jgi:hypothetical protein
MILDPSVRSTLAMCADALDAKDAEIKQLRSALEEIIGHCRRGACANAEFVATRALENKYV